MARTARRTPAQRLANVQAALQRARTRGDAVKARRLSRVLRKVQTNQERRLVTQRSARTGPPAPTPSAAPALTEAQYAQQRQVLQDQLTRAMQSDRLDEIRRVQSLLSTLDTQQAMDYDPEFRRLVANLTPDQQNLLRYLPQGEWREILQQRGNQGGSYLAPAATELNRRGGSPELARLLSVAEYMRRAQEAALAAGDTVTARQIAQQRTQIQAQRRQLFMETLTPDKAFMWAFAPFGVSPIPTPTGPVDQGGPGIAGTDWATMTPDQRREALTNNAAIAWATVQAAMAAGYQGIEAWRDQWQPGQAGTFPEWTPEMTSSFLATFPNALTDENLDTAVNANLGQLAEVTGRSVSDILTPFSVGGTTTPSAGASPAASPGMLARSGAGDRTSVEEYNQVLADYEAAQEEAHETYLTEAGEATAAIESWRTAKTTKQQKIAWWEGQTAAERRAYGFDRYRTELAGLSAAVESAQGIMQREISERQGARSALDAAREETAGAATDVQEAPRDFYTEMGFANPWMPQELLQMFTDLWATYGDEEIARNALFQTPQFAAYFPGIRRDDGTLRMEPIEYVAAKATFDWTLANTYGINPGLLGENFASLIEGDVSMDEWKARMTSMWERVIQAPPEYAPAYARYFGVDTDTAQRAMLVLAMDPKLNQAMLERQVSVAEIAGVAAGQGYMLDQSLAARLYETGIGESSGLELFQGARANVPILGAAGQRQYEGQVSLEQYLNMKVFGSPIEQQRMQRILAGEASAYTEQGLYTRTDYGALTGLRPR